MIATLMLLALLGTSPSVSLEDPPPAAKDATDPLARAKELFDSEEWDEAIGLYRTFLVENPKHKRATEARYYAGYGLVQSGEPGNAVEILLSFMTDDLASEWADKALVQLGQAYRDEEAYDKSREAWDRHIEKFSLSESRKQVMGDLIDLLLRDKRDYAACLKQCERMVQDIPDREDTSEARYVGAYCLNALRRFDDGSKWMDDRFDEESSLESAWRAVLQAQRDLLEGRSDAAVAKVEALPAEFQDLEQDDRIDVVGRAAFVLTEGGKSDRARSLVLDELRHPFPRSEEQAGTLLDQLIEAVGKNDSDAVENALTGLTDPKTPVVVRGVCLDRLVGRLRDQDQDDRAETLLRRALEEDTSEVGRVRIAILLAEVLADDREDAPGAVRVLKDLEPKVKRHDLARKVREAVKGLEDAGRND